MTSPSIAGIDPFSEADLGGLEVPFTPEHTIRGSARYSFANGFFLQGTFRSVGETFFDESNTGFFREGGYEVYDAQIGFRNEQFTIVVYGENLATSSITPSSIRRLPRVQLGSGSLRSTLGLAVLVKAEGLNLRSYA